MEQSVIDIVNRSLQKYSDYVDRRTGFSNGPLLKDLIADTAAAFLGKQPFDDRLVNRIKNETAYELSYFINDVFSSTYYTHANYPWTIDNPVTKQIIHRRNLGSNDALSPCIRNYVNSLLVYDTKVDAKSSIDFLYQQGFSDEDIVTFCISRGAFFKTNPASQLVLTKFSEFIIPKLKPSKGFLGFGQSSGIKKFVDDIVFNERNNGGVRTGWLMLLLDHYPEGIEKETDFLLYKDNNASTFFNHSAAYLFLKKDAPRYTDVIMESLEKGIHNEGERYQLLLAVNAAMKGKYKQIIIDEGEKYLKYFTQPNQAGSYYYEPRVDKKTLSEAYFAFLLEEHAEHGKNRIERFFSESTFLSKNQFRFAEQKFGLESLPWLMEGLKKDPGNLPQGDALRYYDVLFELLKKYSLRDYKAALVDFALERAGKKPRALASAALAGLGDEAMADAKSLVTGKTVDQRVTGALILAAMATPEAESTLNDAVDEESNDDTREIMLEALAEKRFNVPYTHEQVTRMIAVASQRKKLAKWNEKWIDEGKLPKPYWNNGQPLTETDIRFLFYRMKRATGLNSDIEARQALHHIDREKSQAFTKALLTAFQDSNADTKLKYYLTLAALLGDDEMMRSLNTLFRKNMEDKRGKMAEYVIGALAMVGTDKALRSVEVIYRKYAAKKPAISKAARAALDAAATELNITTDELSDRIIPDFGFDGPYKKVLVDGDEYRAFINADFKLNYFTEDNKIRKSLPAGAPKEVKAEFKEIEKEINDVIKSQSGRLEKYLVEERRWNVDPWKKFFFNNPIMFVYALKLLWGVFDKDGNLVNSFYCSEDASCYNVDDEEVELSDDQFVGILHPIILTSEQLKAWKDKAYAMSLTTIFPILERPLFYVNEEEKEGNATKAFFNKDIPKGADFVNTFLVKQNWRKSSGDGGYSEFTKSYKDGLIKAHPTIEGPAAWFQGGNTPAKMFDVKFVGKTWQDKIKLKDVPPVFYSEVLADIHMMINA